MVSKTLSTSVTNSAPLQPSRSESHTEGSESTDGNFGVAAFAAIALPLAFLTLRQMQRNGKAFHTRRHEGIYRIAGAGVALLFLVAGCKPPGLNMEAKPPRVTVAKPVSEPMVDYIEFTGTVGAYQSVNLVARAAGYLEGIHFKDGSLVKKGDLLFTTQQDTYIEDVKLYQAELDYSKAEYDRQLVMFKQNATSEASVQQWLSKLQEAEANTALAKIELGYTEIRAPFDGLMGEHEVDVGNVVGTNQADPTQLATIEQIKPIYVDFSINTRDALRLREQMRKAGIRGKQTDDTIPVYAGLESESGYPHEGLLDFADNSVDTSTGTIQLRAIFKNEDTILFPGLFARVRIATSEPTPRLVVPEACVLSDQQGDYVFVVSADDVVERRNVVKGVVENGNAGIEKGIEADDRVVVRGFGNVRIGQKVVVTDAESGTPSDSLTATPAEATGDLPTDARSPTPTPSGTPPEAAD